MEYLIAFLSWIEIFFNGLSTARMGQLMSLVIITSIVAGIYRLHTNKENPFNLSDLFIDPKTKKVDGSKLRMNLAFFVTSWIVVYSTLNTTMTEWLFAGYLAAWVADRKFSRDADSSKQLLLNDPEEQKESK